MDFVGSADISTMIIGYVSINIYYTRQSTTLRIRNMLFFFIFLFFKPFNLSLIRYIVQFACSDNIAGVTAVR